MIYSYKCLQDVCVHVQVFVNGELVGGSSEILDLLKNGKLQEMLQNAKEDPLPKDLRDLVQNTKSETQVHECLDKRFGADRIGLPAKPH